MNLCVYTLTTVDNFSSRGCCAGCWGWMRWFLFPPPVLYTPWSWPPAPGPRGPPGRPAPAPAAPRVCRPGRESASPPWAARGTATPGARAPSPTVPMAPWPPWGTSSAPDTTLSRIRAPITRGQAQWRKTPRAVSIVQRRTDLWAETSLPSSRDSRRAWRMEHDALEKAH